MGKEEYGLNTRSLDAITTIGVDEIQCGKGHNYLTLVYQIDSEQKRLLSVHQGRNEESFREFFKQLTEAQRLSICYVCSDMWKPYLKVIRDVLPAAVSILDKFHIVKKLNEAVDSVRKEEVKKMTDQGYENILLGMKYCLLKNPENLTENQKATLDDIFQYDLKSVRAYQLKEAFKIVWTYTSPYWAEQYLKMWCTRTMRSQLNPLKKFVKTVRRHWDLILNYFRTKKQYSSGVIEGFNRKVNLITRKAYGYRSFDTWKTMVLFEMGHLEMPQMTHEFV